MDIEGLDIESEIGKVGRVICEHDRKKGIDTNSPQDTGGLRVSSRRGP